jgi:hypothetical protein
MRKLKYIFIFFTACGIAFYSCKKDKPVVQAIDHGYNYFPDEIGSYVIYEVDSIAQDDKSNKHDTTRYQLKELIADTFTDGSGRPTLRIERYKKFYNDTVPYDSMNWVGPRVWYSNKTSTTAEKVEENIRYLKLIFPVTKGKHWDGNTFNTLGQKDYEMTSVDQSETINNNNFDSVVTVKQFEQIDFIEYIYEAEKYARNVGLIYKVRDSLYDGGGSDTIGYRYTQKIVSYGK